MTYIDGFVAAVPQENKQAYLDHVREASRLFEDHGATRMVENWGDDVPVGKATDFHRSGSEPGLSEPSGRQRSCASPSDS